MSLYKVPFDFSHEEKVFGGYLSLRQMIYVILSIVSVGVMFLNISIIFRALIFLCIVSILMTFAFLKIGNVYADKHFINIVRYILRKKIYIFER